MQAANLRDKVWHSPLLIVAVSVLVCWAFMGSVILGRDQVWGTTGGGTPQAQHVTPPQVVYTPRYVLQPPKVITKTKIKVVTKTRVVSRTAPIWTTTSRRVTARVAPRHGKGHHKKG